MNNVALSCSHLFILIHKLTTKNGLTEKGILIMKINMKFTSKGKVAIENFNNEELLEIFARYIKTLSKKYDIEVDVPLEENQNIVGDGAVIATAQNVKCDVETFFKELGRDIKVPLKKRLGGKLENVFKTEITE
ncbi:hypothetical protein D3C78_1015960 [compost metagenome]